MLAAFGKFTDDFIRAFVPLFVAVDAIGLLPLYLGLTEGLDRPAQRKTLRESIITALAVAVGFVIFGKYLLGYMGVSPDDFRIAGGILLFIVSTLDLVSNSKVSRGLTGTVGAVPLGTPLIAGPAVLTASLILADSFGLLPTLLALVVNILLVWAVLGSSELLVRFLGAAGARAVSKVANLILAAFAVMMIREGVLGIIHAAARP